MAIRNLKIVFVIFVSLLCLLYAVDNVINLEACYQTFAYVMSGADNVVYPNSILPATENSVLPWLALVVVVTLEFAAGLLAAKGAWDLWSARKSPAADFNAAKKFALLGCGVGIIVWFGFFAVFGGALFQMWQTEVGRGSLQNAFQFFGACALIFLIVNLTDE